jgi:hypothetical protein
LLSNSSRQSSRLRQARELLCRENGKRLRLDLDTVEDIVLWSLGIIGVGGSRLLGLLEEREAETVGAFMANRQVWEDEVSSWVWSVQISHSRYWNTGENWW